MIASLVGHAEVVDTLLQHGASVDLQNNASAELFYSVIVYIYIHHYLSENVDNK